MSGVRGVGLDAGCSWNLATVTAMTVVLLWTMTGEDTPFDWQPDSASAPLIDRADDESLSVDVRVRTLAHLGLDGPGTVEGRIGGTTRMLFERMNCNILKVAASDSEGDAGIDAWARLAELTVPMLSTCRDFDFLCDVPFYEETARRIDQLPGQVLAGMAHVPGIEERELVAQLISDGVVDHAVTSTNP